MKTTKIKFIAVFIGVIIIWLGSYLIHLNETKDSLKIENIAYSKIDTIEIADQGIPGINSIIINNTDSIKMIAELLKNSRPTNSESINPKATIRVYFIFIHVKNSKLVELYLSNSSGLVGVIRSGDHFYINTALLDFVTKLRPRTATIIRSERLRTRPALSQNLT